MQVLGTDEIGKTARNRTRTSAPDQPGLEGRSRRDVHIDYQSGIPTGGRMVSVQLLLAGVSIMVVAAVCMAVGRIPARIEERMLFQNEGVFRGFGEAEPVAFEFPFTIERDSDFEFTHKPQSGPFEITLYRVPFAYPNGAGSTLRYPADSIGSYDRREAKRRLTPGNYVLEFKCRPDIQLNTQFDLTLRWRIPWVAWLAEVGASLLVIAIPLVITGLLS